ncbi:MAG: nucleotidyltransferase family protein [Rhodanobacteraceae bacterium]|nr:nucleotidyltransferase family protein [Rhodanobacteraceae bacterium]
MPHSQDDQAVISPSIEVVEMLRILFELSSAEFVVSEKPTLAGVDIDRFQQLVARNRISTLAAHYFESGAAREMSASLPSIVAEARGERRLSFSRHLELRRLEEKILGPGKIKYAVLKGGLIDATLYGGQFLRQSSDIDILVEPERVREVVEKLLESGYQFSHERWVGHPVPAVCKYSAVVEMSRPGALQIEVHKSLDEHSIIFPAVTDLDFPRTKVCGFDLPGLAEPVNTLYMIFHHSRHRWSCLHWVMDLIRLCKTLSNPDRVALSHAAENMGLRRTVDEAFKLERDLALVAAGGSLEGLDLSLFTLECLYRVGLSNDEAASLKARSVSTEPDFAFAWQRPRGYDLKAAVSRLGPGENEYRLMPQLSGSAIGMCLVRAFTLSMHFGSRLASSVRSRSAD